MSLLDRYPAAAGELASIALPHSSTLDRQAYLTACANSRPPGSAALYQHLRQLRRRVRHLLNAEERELLWVALSHLHEEDGEGEEEDVIQMLQRHTTYPYLSRVMRVLPTTHPVETYNVGHFRMALEALQHCVADHPYHREMRAYLEDLERHCLQRLMRRSVQYDVDSEQEVDMEDPLFNDYEWCKRTVLPRSTKVRVIFHCNSLFVRSTECYFYWMDDSLRTRERWAVQLHLKSLPTLTMSLVVEDILSVLRGNAWYMDQTQDQMTERHAQFFSFPGEVELTRIRQPDNKVVTVSGALSTLRGRELGVISGLCVNTKPEEIFAYRLAQLKDKEGKLHSHPPGVPPQAVLDERLRRRWYDWGELYCTWEEDRTLLSVLQQQAYVLAFLVGSSIAQNLAPALFNKGAPAKLVSLAQTMALRGQWTPKRNPRFWAKDRFPCLVQTNDFRLHVAVDPSTLLVCPNVETAFYTWRCLRAKPQPTLPPPPTSQALIPTRPRRQRTIAAVEEEEVEAPTAELDIIERMKS